MLAGAGTGQVPVWNGSAWVVGTITPGLSNFTESLNPSTPNATVNVAALTANVSTTNGDMALVPKGSGALLTAIPDNSSTGGNKRGQYAIDLQLHRVNSTEVASGSTSVIVGGYGNSATNSYAIIIGGQNNIASGGHSLVLSGAYNIASGSFSHVVGGQNNTASGYESAVLSGEGNIASGTSSIVTGGVYCTTRGTTGAKAWSGAVNSDAVLGKRQMADYLLSCSTTSATSVRMTTDGNSTASSSNIMAMPNNSVYSINYKLLGRRGSDNVSNACIGNVVISRGASAASTAIRYWVNNTIWDGFTAASVNFTADTTLGGLSITVGGITSTNIDWVCHIECLELTA